MIYLKITGNAGNQFFQYAFARKIMLIKKDELTIYEDDWTYLDEFGNKRLNEKLNSTLKTIVAEMDIPLGKV